MLVNGGAVEVRKSVGVFGEMTRNPVKDNADLVPVKIIHQIFEILRASIAGGGRIISCHLVSPGTVEGMLRDSHKLYMGVSHFFYIFRKLMGEFSVIIETVFVFFRDGMLLPGTGMYFIDSHGRDFFIKILAVLDPYRIFPYIVCNIGNSRGGARSHLSFIGVGIRFIKLLSVHSDDEEFIEIADLRTGNKHFKHADRAGFGHGIGFLVPVIEVSDHGNRLCPGRPYGKIYALLPSLCGGMGSQLLIDIIMCALTEQILVKFRKLHFLSHRYYLP